MVNDIKLQEKPKAPGGFLNSVWVDIAGVAATAAAGVIAARQAINKSFYQNIKIVPEIGGRAKSEIGGAGKTAAIKTGEQKIIGVIEDSKHKTEDILRKVKDASGRVEKRGILYPQIRTQHLNHHTKMNTVLARDYAVENIIDKARLLRPHQRWEVGIKVLATISVALGAMATLASMRSVSNKQGELEQRLNEMENSKQR